MTFIAAAASALCILIATIWTARHVSINRARTRQIPLTPDSAGPPADAPKVSVVIAAKDEIDNIDECVGTMLGQDYPNFEVIAVDDRSTDGTREALDRIAEENPRLKVMSVEHLPDGWCGKNNAMRTGIAAADGAYICMIDADCRQDTARTLSVAVQYAIDNNTDMLSVFPRLETRGWWESVVQPVCGSIMVYWFHPDKVNDPARPEAYANGAFMLFTREAYEAIGGHEAVRNEMMEDLRFAERTKQAGRRLRVARHEGLFRSRMFTSLDAIVGGWGRIFFGTFRTRRKLRVSMILLGMMGVFPYLVAAIGLIAWAATGSAAALAAGACGLVACLANIALVARLYALTGAEPRLCWSWPIGCVVAIAALLKAYSFHRPGAQVTWRNTTYQAAPGD